MTSPLRATARLAATTEAGDRDIATALADHRAVVALAQLKALHHVDMPPPGVYANAEQAVRAALPALQRFLGSHVAHEVTGAPATGAPATGAPASGPTIVRRTRKRLKRMPGIPITPVREVDTARVRAQPAPAALLAEHLPHVMGASGSLASNNARH